MQCKILINLLLTHKQQSPIFKFSTLRQTQVPELSVKLQSIFQIYLHTSEYTKKKKKMYNYQFTHTHTHRHLQTLKLF